MKFHKIIYLIILGLSKYKKKKKGIFLIFLNFLLFNLCYLIFIFRRLEKFDIIKMKYEA